MMNLLKKHSYKKIAIMFRNNFGVVLKKLIYLSMRKTRKWAASCNYQDFEGKIYLLKTIDSSAVLLGFTFCFIYLFHHECLRLLLKKLRIRGFRDEKKISSLAEIMTEQLLLQGDPFFNFLGELNE